MKPLLGAAISLHALEGIPEVAPGQDLAELLGDAIEGGELTLTAGDVIVVCQKIVSKAEGRVVKLDDVEPSQRARDFADSYQKDARVVELALREATEVLRMGDGHLITATGAGFVAANSGIDRSNQRGSDEATLLPEDSDRSAAEIRAALTRRFGVDLAVVVSDTFGRPWRMGQIDVAIGAAGLEVLDDFAGRDDWQGRPLEHTLIAVADQLAAAAGLLMDKAAGIPAVLVRGYRYERGSGRAAQLVRPRETDLFR